MHLVNKRGKPVNKQLSIVPIYPVCLLFSHGFEGIDQAVGGGIV